MSEKIEQKAGEIVSLVKDTRRKVFEMMTEEIDFLGCSQSYVEEKIKALIYALKELDRHCKEVDKRNATNHKD